MNYRFCLAALLLSVSLLQAVEIIGHRGASFDAPENTVASAKLAWEQGADLVELDVHVTSDGKLIVLHDENPVRTTGTKGEVEAMLFDDLRKLDAGSWKDARYAGEKLPTLEELIATMPEGKGLVIEIKKGPETVPLLKKVLEASGKKPSQFIIISFNYDSLKASKAAMPEHKTLLLAGYKLNKKTGKPIHDLPELIRMCQEAKLDGLDLNYKWPIDKAFVKQVKDARLELYTWTVDDAAVAKNLVEAGVDSITTNRPSWLRVQLDKELWKRPGVSLRHLPLGI